MLTNKVKLIIIGVILAVLTAAFLWGENAPEPQAERISRDSVQMSAPTDVSGTAAPDVSVESAVPSAQPQTETAVPKQTAAAAGKPIPTAEAKTPEPAVAQNRPDSNNAGKPMTGEEKEALAQKLNGAEAEPEEQGDTVYSAIQGMQIGADGQDAYGTKAVPEGRPVPIEPQDTVISNREQTCTLSVRCDTILENMAWLEPEKRELVPEDGVILSEREVTFYEGESVFNLLRREMKKNKIHMEFVNTPFYNSAYIEGIHNLYEYDCGELSGWLYRVNGWIPNYGCSRYQLEPGDRVEWLYTCRLGADIKQEERG